MSDMKVVADPGTHEIVITRSFDGPRDLVFKAFTDPDAVRQWWGQANSETVVDQLEARPGGRWRFVEREAEGNEYGFHGVYHDLQAPERIVYTFEYEGMPGHVSVETMNLEDLGGRTRLVSTSVFDSQEDRDGMLQSGMEQGAGESYDRLEAHLQTMR